MKFDLRKAMAKNSIEIEEGDYPFIILKAFEGPNKEGKERLALTLELELADQVKKDIYDNIYNDNEEKMYNLLCATGMISKISPDDEVPANFLIGLSGGLARVRKSKMGHPYIKDYIPNQQTNDIDEMPF